MGRLLEESTYPSPETEYEPRTEERQASAVQIGYEVDGQKVATKKVGSKWTELRAADNSLIKRALNSDPLLVFRMVETPASRERDARARRNRKIIKELQSIDRTFEHAIKKVKEDADTFSFVEYNHLATVIEEQFSRRIWARFKAMVDYADSQGDELDLDLVDIAEEFATELRSFLSDAFRNRALSRSTNVMSNLYDDVEREQTAKFLDNMKWWF